MLRKQVFDVKQVHPRCIASRVVAPNRTACEAYPLTRSRAHDLFTTEREIVWRKGPGLTHSVENLYALGVAIASGEDSEAPSVATGGSTEFAPRALPRCAVAVAPASVAAIGATGGVKPLLMIFLNFVIPYYTSVKKDKLSINSAT